MSTATANFVYSPCSATENVLVASGNPSFRQQMLSLLTAARHRPIEAEGGAEALLKLELGRCRGLVLDRQLPDLDAEELASMVSSQYPDVEIEMLDSAAEILGSDAMELAPEAMDFRSLMRALRGGDRDLGPRPVARLTEASLAFTPRPTAAQVDAALQPPAREAETPALEFLPGLVGRSSHLNDISRLVRMVAPRRTTVLLLGETGTGKEMIARGIHESSARADRPWVVVNCAAIPEALLESELFGYVRGAFTGAMQSRTGRILAAHTGTLFLDEIGELPLALQSKLLRFLQEGELQRLGTNETQKVDVRVVAATNANLMAEVEAGRFRRDLYYRLAVFPIELLPLQRRPEDVLPLTRHFLTALQAESGPRLGPAGMPRLSAAAEELLEAYPWPGNVRELQHTLERAFILAGGRNELQTAQFPALEAWQALGT